jgi:hypothetical protein
MRLILAWICMCTAIVVSWTTPPTPLEMLSLHFSSLFLLLDQIRADLKDKL